MTHRRADVVVFGAGVVGASVAWHLARKGVRDVLVLEREAAPGLGSTSRATGGFRAQFGTEVNVRLSLLARDELRRFAEETGVDPGYHPCGYLFVASSTRDLAALRQAQRVQRAAGLAEAREVDVADIRRLNPAVATESVASRASGGVTRGVTHGGLGDLVGGVFCPTDGFLRPAEVLRGSLAAAMSLGVRVATGVEVTGLALAPGGGRILEVCTPRGTFAAGAFVDAAGAWAAPVARLAQVDLPVVPLRRQVAPTIPTDVLPGDMPMTIFTADGFHLRVRDGRVLLLWPADDGDAATGDPFDTRFDERWLEGVVSRAHARIPCLRGVPVDRARCWAGLYEMSPDRHAILGAAPGCANLWLANGSSGHGVMHAPALGRLLAEMIVDGRASSMDVHALRPTRFAEGQPNVGPDLL